MYSVLYSPHLGDHEAHREYVFMSGLESVALARRIADNLEDEFPDQVAHAWVEKD